MNDLAATIIITIKGNKGMSHNNSVSARGGNSCSVVSHCKAAGTAGQRFTTATSGKKESG